MDEPKYVLKTYEKVDVPTSGSGAYTFVRTATWIVVGVIIVGSIIFQSSILGEMSWTSRMMLIALVIGVSFCGPKCKPTASPIEIRFYDDYLVVFREKRYYSRKVSRKEYNKFLYPDISKIEYDYRTKRLDFIGKIDAMWFDYNKDGSVPQDATYHRVVDGGICYFYVINNDAESIISTIEKYAGKKVLLSNDQEYGG